MGQSYKEILKSDKKEQTVATLNNISEAHSYYVEQ